VVDRLKLASDDGGIELHDARFEHEGLLHERDYWMDFEATVENALGRYETHLTMISPYRADMLGFFVELSEGAEQTRWDSEHAEMSIDATQLGEAYHLDVAILGSPTLSRNDRLRLTVARSECRRFAPELARFLRVDEPFRLRAAPLT
jgi:hypothetical protein